MRSTSFLRSPSRALAVGLALLAVGCAASAPPPTVVVPDLRGTWTGTWGGTPLTLLVTEQQIGHGDSGLVIGPWQVLGVPYPTVSGVMTSSLRGEEVSTRMDGLVADAGGRLVVNVRARSRAGEQTLTLRLVDRDRLQGSGESQYAWGPRGPVQLARRTRPVSPGGAGPRPGSARIAHAGSPVDAMARINEHYLNLSASYLFAEIKRRTEAFRRAHPEARLISLGIGDVTQPLPAVVIAALEAAVREQAHAETLKGYGPYVGYEWLRAAIAAHDFGGRGVPLGADEIFVSDGGKSDGANIQEIFADDCVVALMDPVYPVYADSNVMAGRGGPVDERGRYAGFVYLPCTAENGFLPALPDRHVDLIYLCYPNNPTGAVMTRAALQQWVDYAREHEAVILYDAAYEAYIRDPAIPHSIYEIDGAREVAIESRSFSKSAGFTGVRLAYTVVPDAARGRTADGESVGLRELWLRRMSTKSNGPPYVVQKAAAALYTPDGQKQVRALTDFYMENARLIREGLTAAGLTVHGGTSAPYIWARTPAGLSSWDFFDKLLAETHVVGAPGSGFGPSGEGYFRLTAFGSREQTAEAVERIRTRLR